MRMKPLKASPFLMRLRLINGKSSENSTTLLLSSPLLPYNFTSQAPAPVHNQPLLLLGSGKAWPQANPPVSPLILL